MKGIDFSLSQGKFKYDAEIKNSINIYGRGRKSDRAITKRDFPRILQSILNLMNPMEFQKQYPAPKSSHLSPIKASELFEWR